MGGLIVFLRVDGDRCMGHGRCYTVAPDLLSDDEQGYVAQCGTTIPVPADLVGQAEEAANSCPEMAIELIRR
jgi:ferredoxin